MFAAAAAKRSTASTGERRLGGSRTDADHAKLHSKTEDQRQHKSNGGEDTGAIQPLPDRFYGEDDQVEHDHEDQTVEHEVVRSPCPHLPHRQDVESRKKRPSTEDGQQQDRLQHYRNHSFQRRTLLELKAFCGIHAT